MSYINKWVTSNGRCLTKNEYNSLYSSAYKKKISLENYLATLGIEKRYSTGPLQDPLDNSAELTYWTKEVDGKILFLTKWKYKHYCTIAKTENKTVTKFLRDLGFTIWKELFNEEITIWIDKKTRLPLSRKDYIRYSNKIEKGKSINEYLDSQGYIKIKDKKQRSFYDK